MREQDATANVVVLQDRQAVPAIASVEMPSGSDSRLPVAALIEGDHAIVTLEEDVPHDTPLDDAHIDAMGEDDCRALAGGDSSEEGAVRSLDELVTPRGSV